MSQQYFKRYIQRILREGRRSEYFKPFVGWVKRRADKLHYTENRPWTDEFKKDQFPIHNHPRVLLEPIPEWKVFKGDRVQILVGKDKGKVGIINSVIKERNWCFVAGLNVEYKKHQMVPDSMPTLIMSEKPLMITNQVSLIDPADSRPTEVEWRYTEKGERVRVSVRTGRIIPLPIYASETEDFVVPSTFAETAKDTKEKELTEVTFVPVLKTFEQDIMDAMGIKETRQRAKTYWY